MKSTAIPLAILSDVEYPEGDAIVLEPADTVLLLTDGLQEARSGNDQYFGTERILECVRENGDKTPRQIVEKLLRCAQEHCQPAKPIDDITVVIIKVTA